jgi:hypothetical protein
MSLSSSRSLNHSVLRLTMRVILSRSRFFCPSQNSRRCFFVGGLARGRRNSLTWRLIFFACCGVNRPIGANIFGVGFGCLRGGFFRSRARNFFRWNGVSRLNALNISRLGPRTILKRGALRVEAFTRDFLAALRRFFAERRASLDWRLATASARFAGRINFFAEARCFFA